MSTFKKKLTTYLLTLAIILFSQHAIAGSLRDLINSLDLHEIADEEKNPSRYHLAAAAIFQNEASYLREWIEYHKMIGVDHFYLYNNLSDDECFEVLKSYIDSGLVDLIDWPYQSVDNPTYDRIQCDAYRDALEKCDCKWLAVIDIDEFLVPVDDNNLKSFLAHYEDDPTIGGVVLPWVFFGTSHVQKIPENKLLIETLILNGGPAAGGDPSAIWNSGQYKSIIRPKRVAELVSPHYCAYKSGKRHTMVPFEQGQINHYWTRDESFLYDIKIPRRQKWGQSTDSVISWANGMNNETIHGERIIRFIPLLKKIMGYSDEN